MHWDPATTLNVISYLSLVDVANLESKGSPEMGVPELEEDDGCVFFNQCMLPWDQGNLQKRSIADRMHKC